MPRPNAPVTTSIDHQLRRRALVLATGFVCIFSGLSFRLFRLQVVERDRYREEASRLRLHQIAMPARRGAITDRNGEVVACDQLFHSLIIDKYHLHDPNLGRRTLAEEQGIPLGQVPILFSENKIRNANLERALRLLAPALKKSTEELRALIEGPEKMEIELLKDMADADYQPLKELVDRERIAGVNFRETMRRLYPVPNRLGHVLGFVDAENKGVEGVEKSMNSTLAGVDGFREIERDRKGRELKSEENSGQDPKDGSCVQLTIHLALQQIVEEELSRTDIPSEFAPIPSLGVKKASVIIMEPGTGAILALANWPPFDLEKKQTRNHAVADTYEPGSTFKLNAIAGALDAGLVTPRTLVNTHGGELKVGTTLLRDDHPADCLEVMGIAAHSSNIGAYKLAAQLGRDRFNGYVRAFGFGEKTGVELTAESPGYLRQPEKWTIDSMPHLAMGYEVTITPLQLCSAVATIAGDGTRCRPHVVSAITTPDGRMVEKREPEKISQVVSSEAAKMARRCLREVVIKGTGASADLAGYPVAGKTGTAWKFIPGETKKDKGRYDVTKRNVSFAGFAPYENPALVCLVIVDDPETAKAAEFGATIAAPVFRRVMERALPAWGVAPDASYLPVKSSRESPLAGAAKPAATISPVPPQKSRPAPTLRARLNP